MNIADRLTRDVIPIRDFRLSHLSFEAVDLLGLFFGHFGTRVFLTHLMCAGDVFVVVVVFVGSILEVLEVGLAALVLLVQHESTLGWTEEGAGDEDVDSDHSLLTLVIL